MNNIFSKCAHSGYDTIPLFLRKQNIAISKAKSDARVYKSGSFVYFPSNGLMWDTRRNRSYCLSSLSGQQSKNKEAFVPKIRIDWRYVSSLLSVCRKIETVWRSVYGFGFLVCFVFFLVINQFFFIIFIQCSFKSILKYVGCIQL